MTSGPSEVWSTFSRCSTASCCIMGGMWEREGLGSDWLCLGCMKVEQKGRSCSNTGVIRPPPSPLVELHCLVLQYRAEFLFGSIHAMATVAVCTKLLTIYDMYIYYKHAQSRD